MPVSGTDSASVTAVLGLRGRIVRRHAHKWIENTHTSESNYAFFPTNIRKLFLILSFILFAWSPFFKANSQSPILTQRNVDTKKLGGLVCRKLVCIPLTLLPVASYITHFPSAPLSLIASLFLPNCFRNTSVRGYESCLEAVLTLHIMRGCFRAKPTNRKRSWFTTEIYAIP